MTHAEGFSHPFRHQLYTPCPHQVKYKNDHIEVAWALGAGIQMLAA